MRGVDERSAGGDVGGVAEAGEGDIDEVRVAEPAGAVGEGVFGSLGDEVDVRG